MLQPRIVFGLFFLCLLSIVLTEQSENIQKTNRKKRQDGNDLSTVLLVDNHGRSSYGRFYNVKPSIGVVTSTARTFVQEGVTTEYATQVLGTTLNDGRLYAQLLTKSTRVRYDDTRTHPHPLQTASTTVVPSVLPPPSDAKTFIGNTDYVVAPTRPEPILIYPTKSKLVPIQVPPPPPAPKFFKINRQYLPDDNLIRHKDEFGPSKVKGYENLPTFTVRNEFSPSGFSYVDGTTDTTERNKLTTITDRKAKLLFKAGLVKPKNLETVTYTGFADFTTTVADTVIIFTPHTLETSKNLGQITKITVEPTIKPSTTFKTIPTSASTASTTSSTTSTTTSKPSTESPITTTTEDMVIEESLEPEPVDDEDVDDEEAENVDDVVLEEMSEEPQLHTIVLDKNDRTQSISMDFVENSENMDAKSAVLAHEQGSTIIEPSESQVPMLSTPSDEDIAKIFAMLQSQAKQATEPLNKPATIFFDDTGTTSSSTTTTSEINGGAKTIFFDDVDDDDEDVLVEPTQEITTITSSLITEVPPPTSPQSPQTTTDEILIDDVITTENEPETTTDEPELIGTTTEIESDLEDDEIDEICTDGTKLIPTTVLRTLTYLTSFFIPDGTTTSTSIKANEIVSTEIGLETELCNSDENHISPTTTTDMVLPTEILQEPQVDDEDLETSDYSQSTTEETEAEPTTLETIDDGTTMITTTERRHVTENDEMTEGTTTENGDEIEVIYKTLYTTYTYLTTYFQDSTSSIDSRIVVTTNVITSTLEPGTDMTDSAVAGLFERDNHLVVPELKTRTPTFDDFPQIVPPDTDNAENDDDDENQVVQDSTTKPTPTLDDVVPSTANIKTYYTTYTYFTTIFVDGETEISSRTEIYTNYVTPSIEPTKVDSTIGSTAKESLKILNLNVVPSNSYNSTISRPRPTMNTVNDDDNNIVPSSTKKSGYVTLNRKSTDTDLDDNILDLNDYETISTTVTDVRSSTSEGARRLIDNVKRNVLLDDQILSESNNESEIVPTSPTLLLQTSYTTFTYFTTMYHGTTSSDVVSRLETITNVVTETLTPTHTLSVEDLSLPITYFTTFTYWTTLYKEGTTKVTSREETVSNIITPTPTLNDVVPTISSTLLESDKVPPTSSSTTIEPSIVGDDDLTTYFTTYTYYTTSYLGNSTVLNSRLETVTNIVNGTSSTNIATPAVGRTVGTAEQNVLIDDSKIKSTGLLSTVLNSEEHSGTTTIKSTDIYGTYIDGVYAKVLESTTSIITPTPIIETKPTGVVSINHGKIVDADGISTLYYTTQALGTFIDNHYAQIIDSTSSLKVNEERKSVLATDLTPINHRTGLVRLIQGTIVQNHTTTLYESKVLGTLIDGRYAQIIESTSSFIVGTITDSVIKPSSTISDQIVPTPTQATDLIASSAVPITPSPVVIEGSISKIDDADGGTNEENSTESELEIDEQEEEEEEGNTRKKSRLTFQTKKRTFTPVIRPFASRPRPTFAPKRKGLSPSTATTVTRSDITPTVTAVPASKQSRFGNRRSSSSTQIVPTASGTRRFSRPKSSNANGRRNSSSSTISNRLQSSSTRRSGFRSSSTNNVGLRSSSVYPGNSRFRIRPTSSYNRNGATSTTVASIDRDNDVGTTVVTDNPTDLLDDDENETTLSLASTTEGRRSSNPLLKFRRPPLGRPPLTRSTTPRSTNGRTTSKNLRTTTTTKPKSNFNRPVANRPRTNSLFPRRNLFTTTTTTPVPLDEDDEDLDAEDFDDENLEEDTDYESSQRETQTEPAPTTPGAGGTTRNGRAFNSSPILIKPFNALRRRNKRQTINYSRFRRPGGTYARTTAQPTKEPEPEIEVTPKSTTRSKTGNRFAPRHRNGKSTTHGTTTTTTTTAPSGRKRIAPSKTQGRSQFTLREKDTTQRSNYRRTNARTSTTIASRPKQPRLRNKYQTEPSTGYNRKSGTTTNRSRTSNRRGTTAGTRQRTQPPRDFDNDILIPQMDGTITVTHQIPTEVTIPIVSGTITEYKNVITAKYSTEILAPRQYSTSINPFGKDVTVLLSEGTSLADNGATLITQYILNETPTSSVTFTPTYIRGRKTKFSHVVPSTAYGVETVVNTIQPALAAQAPLANILLSQLLLGGLQPQNPLIGFQNAAAAAAVPPTPTTEFKTRTTTYVTTVTSETSTVLPLTFRGKEILTTIIDSSTTVVTATEYLTDTVVVTPTLANQLNTLLLPLLQQQLQQQQQQQQQQIPLQQHGAGVFELGTIDQPQAQALYQSEPDELNLAEDTEPTTKKSLSGRKRSGRKPAVVPPPPKETSIVTLYVSGRTPGEFSTILSTVIVGENDRRKREVPIEPSRRYKEPIVDSTIDLMQQYLGATDDSDGTKLDEELLKETESLESILGDVPTYYNTHTKIDVTRTTYKSSSKIDDNGTGTFLA